MITTKDLKLLAKLERDMDEGKQPFVIYGGGRLAVKEECMEEFGLKNGQTINPQIATKIFQWNLADCQAQMAIEKAKSKI
jgi:hypothetical protein